MEILQSRAGEDGQEQPAHRVATALDINRVMCDMMQLPMPKQARETGDERSQHPGGRQAQGVSQNFVPLDGKCCDTWDSGLAWMDREVS